MATYLCDDGNCEVEIDADSAQDAAQQYVDDGEWGEINSTTWIKVSVVQVPEYVTQWVKIVLQPDEPACDEDQVHNWQSPIELVGGLKENPGVFGHGGGVSIHEVCLHCGTERVTDTWAQDRSDGEQGLESVEYRIGEYLDRLAELESEAACDDDH